VSAGLAVINVCQMSVSLYCVGDRRMNVYGEIDTESGEPKQ
jgi:hypothetical protein